MSLDHGMETTGNVQYFVFEHSSSYRQTQMRFLQAVESLNPENIIVSGCTTRTYWNAILNVFILGFHYIFYYILLLALYCGKFVKIFFTLST